MNENLQYVIGFDLGDGESSIAFTSVNGDDEPKLFEFAPGETSQVTAIAEDNEGLFIGTEAMRRHRFWELFINFKSNPITNPKLWRRNKRKLLQFAEEFFIELIELKPYLKKNAQVYIGHPSAWLEDAVEAYKDLFLKSDDIPPVQIVPESRAAFIQVRDYRGVSGDALLESVLVIDIGSSTTDFTHVQGLNAKEIPLKPLLGARQIDNEIFCHTLDIHPDKKEQLLQEFKENPPFENLCRYLCRKVKEKFFTAIQKSSNPTVREYDPLVEEFRPTLDKLTMDAILRKPLKELQGRSWLDHYRHLLIEARSYLVSSPPKVVLLTGGGSRMQFTQKICREVFDKSQVVLDDQPSFCVAKGLAGFGRWEFRVEKFRASVEEFCQSDRVTQIISKPMSTFLKKVKYPVLRVIYDDVWNPFIHALRLDKINLSEIDNIDDYLVQKGKVCLNSESATKIIKPVINNFTQQIEPKLLQETNEICSRFHIPKGSLSFELSISERMIQRVMKGTDLIVRIVDKLFPKRYRTIIPAQAIDLHLWLFKQATRFAAKIEESLDLDEFIPIITTDVQTKIVEDIREQIREQLKAQAEQAAVYIQ